MRRFCMAVVSTMLVLGQARAEFLLKDKPGEQIDVLLDGRVVARWMYAYDKTKLHDTYKPYLHVFDAEGKSPITKGPGGQFTHHRGIFLGWNKIGCGGKTFDRWHMKGGEMVQQKMLRLEAGRDRAEFTSLIHWNDEASKAILAEERTHTFRRAPAPARLMVDLATRLKPAQGDVALRGDPEHAGVQYRPAAEIVGKETTYVFPVEKAVPTKDVDYPWVGETYTLGARRYSVVHINHPRNPKPTKYSAYRDYGRFGAFFETTIPAGGVLELNYRFLVADGPMPAAAVIQECCDEFAGASSPSPTPKMCVMSAAQSKPAKKRNPDKIVGKKR